jgi:putative addiction module component (TIGR02574 family)
MSPNAEAIMNAALALPPEERASLAERLLDSLQTEQQEIDRCWTEVAEKRLAAYRRGEVRAVPADEFLQRLRAGKTP